MTARWDRMPTKGKAKGAKPRRAKHAPCTYRCEGVHGCGETFTCTYPQMERHVDTEHGGYARIAIAVTSAR